MYHVLTIIIRATTDIDVLVLAVAEASVLDGCELWLAFGHGVNFRNIPVHVIVPNLGAERSILSCYIRCQTVSFIHEIGKKTAWDICVFYVS